MLILSRPKALTTPLCAFHILQHFQGKRKEIFLPGRLSAGEQENFLPRRLPDGKTEKFPAGKTFYRETASAGHDIWTYREKLSSTIQFFVILEYFRLKQAYKTLSFYICRKIPRPYPKFPQILYITRYFFCICKIFLIFPADSALFGPGSRNFVHHSRKNLYISKQLRWRALPAAAPCQPEEKMRFLRLKGFAL